MIYLAELVVRNTLLGGMALFPGLPFFQHQIFSKPLLIPPLTQASHALLLTRALYPQHKLLLSNALVLGLVLELLELGST